MKWKSVSISLLNFVSLNFYYNSISFLVPNVKENAFAENSIGSL